MGKRGDEKEKRDRIGLFYYFRKPVLSLSTRISGLPPFTFAKN
jgi:hypothetical protein